MCDVDALPAKVSDAELSCELLWLKTRA